MALRAVLFDMGSTLIEFENHDWSELVSMGAAGVYDELQRCGFSLPAYERFHDVFTGRYNEFWSRSGETWKEVCLHDIFDAAFSELRILRVRPYYPRLTAAHYRPISAQTHLFDDVPEGLRVLRERGLRLGIISNTPWPSHLHLEDLSGYGLEKFFDVCIFSAEVGVRKPHARIFKIALDMMQVEAHEVIYVGDRYVEDVWGPQQLGIKSVLREHPRRAPEPDIVPDARIRLLSDLLPLIENGSLNSSPHP